MDHTVVAMDAITAINETNTQSNNLSPQPVGTSSMGLDRCHTCAPNQTTGFCTMTRVPRSVMLTPGIGNILGSIGVVITYSPKYTKQKRNATRVAALQLCAAPIGPDAVEDLLSSDCALVSPRNAELGTTLDKADSFIAITYQIKS